MRECFPICRSHAGQFPALELSKMGYNRFAPIYRPDDPYTDLVQAIGLIYNHAEELKVNSKDCSFRRGSAEARMAATLGNEEGRGGIPGGTVRVSRYPKL